MKKNEYRCSGCNEIKNRINNKVWVAWFRSKETQSFGCQKVAMCRKCAFSQKKGETGRKLYDRIMFEKLLKNLVGF